MDPLSISVGVVGLADTVTRLSRSISRFTKDYQLADEDLDVARSHALLLKEEIRGLEARLETPPPYSPSRTTAPGWTDSDGPVMGETSFEKAMVTARDLLSSIEAAFPLRSEPHTWRSKVRWALRDKKTLASLMERLRTAESTLQGIMAVENMRISQMVYGMLCQQQPVMEKLERGELLGANVIKMAAVLNRSEPSKHSEPTVVQARLSQLDKTELVAAKQPTQVVTKPAKLLPRSAAFSRWGFTAQLVTLPKDGGTDYRAALHMSLFGKMYSVQLRVSQPGFSFERTLQVRNMVPDDCEMAAACRTGDFDRARSLLNNNLAHGSDVTESGLPMLDYAIQSGSTRLVSLLLQHGAQPDLAYGEHNMTALQSSFLRGKLDMARMLLNRGADIEHVDSDGYSVLSYLWVVDKKIQNSADFMRLCLSRGFSEVNSCDSRGWTGLHRAAAIGTAEDVEAFLRLGASLSLRAEWYGWTALFFAVSHDNIDTFQTIVAHSGPDVYESLDGDGWNILHCSIYFGAPRVMRLVLQSGIDVNRKTDPAPLPEDPELSYRELTAADIAIYMGPNRYRMFMDALVATGRDADLEGAGDDIFWDATPPPHEDNGDMIYGAEDFDDRWTLLHWASYNGSLKVKRLLLMKGADPEHLDAIALEDNPTLLPKSLFEGR